MGYHKQTITVQDLEIILKMNGFRKEVEEIKDEAKSKYPERSGMRRQYRLKKFEEIYNQHGPFR